MIRKINNKMATLLIFGFTKPSASKPSNETVDANQDENNNDSSPVQAGSKTMAAKRCFTAHWLKCKFCKISKRLNPFGLDGSKIFQRSALERHQSSDDHRLATSNKKQSEVLIKTS